MVLLVNVSYFINENDVHTANFIISCHSSFGVYSPLFLSNPFHFCSFPSLHLYLVCETIIIILVQFQFT